MLDDALAAIAGRVAARPGKGTPVVVFNPLSWPVTAPVSRVRRDRSGTFPYRRPGTAKNGLSNIFRT